MTVTVNLDHIPTHEIDDERWVQIAVSLLHNDEHATRTLKDDVASLLADNSRLARELEQAREDLAGRWAESDHLAAKYHRMYMAERSKNRAAA